jgi:hypothetical protein
MDPHMDLQSTVSREGLAAFLAHDVLPTLVLSEHMLIEILLADHPSLAYLTFVFRLVMREFLVHVQGVAVEAGLAADVADDRLFSMAEAYVVCQVTLDFELLAAGLAGELEVVRVLASDMYLQLVLVLVLVIALTAIKQFRLRIAAICSRLSVFSLDVRVQR